MNELPSVAVVLAALISGLILGFSISTNFEYKLRGNRESILNRLRTGSVFSVSLKQVLWLIIVSVAMVATAVLIMQLGDAYPLSKIDRYVFVVFWFLSIACAKYIRYLYWKKKYEKFRY